MMEVPLLQVNNLSFNRNNRRLIDDISFSLQKGEIIGVIGPNGAGKSTLLKNIIGYHDADNGVISIQGSHLASLSHKARALRVSYMAQHPETAFPFSVSETIALGAHNRADLQAISEESIQHQVLQLAEQLELAHLLKRKLTELSGGETQLVHFARIIMQQAPVILLDEPTASLDIGHEAQLMNLLRNQCNNGQAALVAIHNLNIAAAFCDRVLLIDHGKLIACGPPEEVITQANMTALYQQRVLVSKHPITGTVSVLPMKATPEKVNLHIHLIGGAGSTVALCRLLLQMGIRVTGGIGHLQDSDTEFWAATGIEHVTVPAFSPIERDAVKQATPLVRSADITILCEFPIGAMNEGNLQLAQAAKSLWILEDAPEIDEQRFHNAHQKKAFEQLKTTANTLGSIEAITAIKNLITDTKG